ncbi:MAG: Crp/Fnr family transcriptional regulator [Chitinophagaceae bacterium]|nr:MAG: Crp/Fnr family transcriptional regulator [Chitinophagaceae bacterium]
MFEKINAHASQCANFSATEFEIFNALLEIKTVPKKTMLLQEGDICNFEAYINKGCIRSYYLDENGFEITLQFAIEDWWVSDITSFHDHTPSNMFIETLEDCELLCLSPSKKDLLLQQVPKFERFFRLLVQRNLSAVQKRLFHTIAWPAQDRYLDFICHYPTIPQRVPQHYIASFLGISPEFLSKIRSKLSKSQH